MKTKQEGEPKRRNKWDKGQKGEKLEDRKEKKFVLIKVIYIISVRYKNRIHNHYQMFQ
jgi:hypothetical protein